MATDGTVAVEQKMNKILGSLGSVVERCAKIVVK